MMKAVFVGTSEFAVPSLEALIASAHEVVAVVTQPDRPKGRSGKPQMSRVKEIALAHSIPTVQPERIRKPESITEIQEFGPVGAMVVAAYGQIIPPDLLSWPTYGCINVHGSILPKYRGAAPIQHAIIAGEKQTGVTTMLMDAGLDTGDILLQGVVDIGPHETYGELQDRLAWLGAELLIRTLNDLEDGRVAAMPQDDDLATEARSLSREAGAIDWTQSADDIVNRIRGCTPRPGAYTRLCDSSVKVWAATVSSRGEQKGRPGEIVAIGRDGIEVAAGSGAVMLVEVQPESRKRMSAADFSRGGLKVCQVFDSFAARVSNP